MFGHVCDGQKFTMNLAKIRKYSAVGILGRIESFEIHAKGRCPVPRSESEPAVGLKV